MGDQQDGWTIREIAEEYGLAPGTVRLHRGANIVEWESWEVGARRRSGRGRPEKVYDPAKVAAFYQEAEQASAQGVRGPKRKAGTFDPDEIVGWATIAERLNVKADTVRGYPSQYAGSSNPFPKPVPSGVRWGDVEAWDEGRGGSRRKAGSYNPKDIVGWATIAERLNVKVGTARGFPSQYAESDTPFPTPIPKGMYRWGDIEAWDDRREGSGNWEPRTAPPDDVPADAAQRHLRTLRDAGLSLAQIAALSAVPRRTVQRVSTGDLKVLAPGYETALLQITAPGEGTRRSR